MKWIKSDIVQNTFAMWATVFLGIIAFHFIKPDDLWIQMLYRPLVLIFAPLLVAGVWLLITMPAPDSTDDDHEGTSSSKKKRLRLNLLRRMALIWVVSLIVFATPHRRYLASVDPILHTPAFLIIVPLALAGIPWITYKE